VILNHRSQVGTVILLVGPKAVGKTWVAETLSSVLGIAYVDADVLILDLLSTGQEPDTDVGWLMSVERAVCDVLTTSGSVSVEATGAWDSDYQLAHDLEALGHRVIRIWLKAPEETTIARLIARPPKKVPVSEALDRSIFARCTSRAAREQWHLEVDHSGEKDAELIADLVRAIM